MPSIRDVVALVRGASPEPPWLEARLTQSAHSIQGYVESEERAPTRKQFRERLDAFRAAAATLREGLSDPLFVTYIGNDWSSVPLRHDQIMNTLETLGNRASVLSMSFSGTAGAGRAYPVEKELTLASKELCAWTVMQAIMKCQNRTVVGPDDATAWHAANALYQISGGMPLFGQKQPDGSRGEPSGWRDHIISARHIAAERSSRGAMLIFIAQTFETRVADETVILEGN